MFNPERYASAALGLMEAQMAFFTSMVHAHVDAMQTQLATATVATRPWPLMGPPAGTAVRAPTTWYRVRPN
jgi:hypothetical protein